MIAMTDNDAMLSLSLLCPEATKVFVGRVDLKGRIVGWKGPDFVQHSVHIRGKTKRKKMTFTTVGEIKEMTSPELESIAKRHNDFVEKY